MNEQTKKPKPNSAGDSPVSMIEEPAIVVEESHLSRAERIERSRREAEARAAERRAIARAEFEARRERTRLEKEKAIQAEREKAVEQRVVSEALEQEAKVRRAHVLSFVVPQWECGSTIPISSSSSSSSSSSTSSSCSSSSSSSSTLPEYTSVEPATSVGPEQVQTSEIVLSLPECQDESIHLFHLPREMLLRILSFLAPVELPLLAATCRLLWRLVHTDNLWRRHAIVRWDELQYATEVDDWYFLYQRKHREQQTTYEDLMNDPEFRRCDWYTCSNGHPYMIGECRLPMILSRCPTCGEKIGGRQHSMLRSNRRIGAVKYSGQHDVTKKAISEVDVSLLMHGDRQVAVIDDEDRIMRFG